MNRLHPDAQVQKSNNRTIKAIYWTKQKKKPLITLLSLDFFLLPSSASSLLHLLLLPNSPFSFSSKKKLLRNNTWRRAHWHLRLFTSTLNVLVSTSTGLTFLHVRVYVYWCGQAVSLTFVVGPFVALFLLYFCCCYYFYLALSCPPSVALYLFFSVFLALTANALSLLTFFSACFTQLLFFSRTQSFTFVKFKIFLAMVGWLPNRKLPSDQLFLNFHTRSL